MKLTNIIFNIILIVPSFGYGIVNYPSIFTCTDLKAAKIVLPSALTTHNHAVSFKLKVQPLKCLGQKFPASISLKKFVLKQGRGLRTMQNKEPERMEFKHFTSDGSILFGDLYYPATEYCIQSIEKEQITLSICRQECNTKTPCIPKCCDMDYVMGIDQNCAFSGTTNWKPIIYDTADSSKPNSDERFRVRKNTLNCTSSRGFSLRKLPFGSGILNTRFRILGNGSAMYLWNSSSWQTANFDSYCTDGIQGYSRSSLFYTGSSDDAFLRVCLSSIYNNSTTTTGESVLLPTFYGLVMVISCGLLVTTLAVYLLLRKKHNFHIWVVTSYVVSLLLLNLFFGISNLITQVSTVMHTKSMMTDSIGCIIVGCAAHLFLLSTFCWLTMTNLNLWFTFRTSVIEKYGVKRFLIYSIFCWGIPIIIVGLGNVLDHLHKNGYPALLSPNYGKGRCLLSVPAEGVYVFYPVGTLLVFNTMLLLSTVKMFKNSQTIRSRRQSGTGSEKQIRLMKIHIMLFLMATFQWTAEILAWYFRWDTSVWYWILIVLATLMQSVLIFTVFVCGRNALASLEGQYSFIKRASTYFSRKNRDAKSPLLVPKSKDESNN